MEKCNGCILKDEVANYKNQLVLCEDQVYELLGVKIEPEDLYYILKDLFGKLLFSSCVGTIVPLFNRISEIAYENLYKDFKRNDLKKIQMEDETKHLECFCEDT